MDRRRMLRKKESSRWWWHREKVYRHPILSGNGQFGEWVNVSRKALDNQYISDIRIEKSSYASGFRESSSNTSSGISTCEPMDKEILKEKEIRHQSPSIIGRLMGLDTLSRQADHRQRNITGWHFKKSSSLGLREKHTFLDDGLHGRTIDEHQKFKYVFEVMESCTVDRNNKEPIMKGIQCPKGVDTNICFSDQQFIDLKGLSTDDMVVDSKELKGTFEVLHSEGDLFLKPLHETNFLFAKHLPDLKCRDITILKSSKATMFKGSNLSHRPDRNAERCTHVQKDIMSSLPKPGSTQHHTAQSSSVSHMLKSEYADKFEASPHPTKIVLLKPTLGKKIHSGSRSHGEFLSSQIVDFDVEGREGQKFSCVGTSENKAKSSRTSKNIRKEKINDVMNDIEKVRASSFNKYITGDSTNKKSHMSYHKSYRMVQPNSKGLYDQYKRYKPSSSYSTEISVNREARRCLSHQWKIAHQFGEMMLADRGSNTLAEMLALSDKEISKTSPEFLVIQNVSNRKFSRHDTQARFPIIINRDGWKNGCTRSISSSSSITHNSKIHRRLQTGANGSHIAVEDAHRMGANRLDIFYPTERLSYRSSRFSSDVPSCYDSGQSKHMLPAWDTHVSAKSRKKVYMNNLFGKKLVDPDEVSAHKEKPPGTIVTYEDSGGQFKRIVVLSKKAQYEGVQGNAVIEDPYIGHSPVGALHPSCDRLEPSSPIRLEELERPSLVSVLEPLLEGNKCSSGCFDAVSADLHELPMQPQLLKLESRDTDLVEYEILAVSKMDTGEHCHSHTKFGGIIQELKNEEEREFSYLLDVLVYSGVYGASQNRIFDACYSPEHPVCPDIFEKLEKNYGGLSGWTKSERKLFFDLINITLAQFLGPCLDFHPRVKLKRKFGQMFARERLVEEAWQMVIKLRKELCKGKTEDKVLDPMWLDLGDDVDIIGREIEGMLKKELLEELVSEFLLW